MTRNRLSLACAAAALSTALLSSSPAAHVPPLDRPLVAAAQRDPGKFDALYRRYLAPVYSYAYYELGDHHAAEDVTERTFLAALANLHRFDERARPSDGDGASTFKVWLFRIARNHVISHYRRQNTRKSDGEVPEWLPDEALGPAELTERSVTIEEVFAVVKALPAAQREVIQLRFGAGLSIGCFNAWHWVAREHREIRDEQEGEDE